RNNDPPAAHTRVPARPHPPPHRTEQRRGAPRHSPTPQQTETKHRARLEAAFEKQAEAAPGDFDSLPVPHAPAAAHEGTTRDWMQGLVPSRHTILLGASGAQLDERKGCLR